MRVETFPLIIGILVALVGIGIMFDAWTPDAIAVSQERRRRPRIERHRNGEAMIGIGVLALAAAFIGRDNWRYSILVVIIGALFLIAGTVLNARYVRDLFVNRGPLRRREPLEQDFGTTPGAVADRPPASEPADPGRREGPAAWGGWGGTERRRAPRDGDRKSRRPDSGSPPPSP
ncbi:MAG TPA: hypothetical protein VJO33_18060 [Gemmatimonadaceae bacterium]|nr:hypothetical protein [Gemmatimonadaceae bacterium]